MIVGSPGVPVKPHQDEVISNRIEDNIVGGPRVSNVRMVEGTSLGIGVGVDNRDSAIKDEDIY